MTYTEQRIARKMAESPEYRAAFEEELRELEHRQQLMAMVASLRKTSRLSQRELAEKMKVSQARISQMERGTEPVSVDNLLRMIELLKGGLVILSPAEVEELGLTDRLIANGHAIRRLSKVGQKETVPAK